MQENGIYADLTAAKLGYNIDSTDPFSVPDHCDVASNKATLASLVTAFNSSCLAVPFVKSYLNCWATAWATAPVAVCSPLWTGQSTCAAKVAALEFKPLWLPVILLLLLHCTRRSAA